MTRHRVTFLPEGKEIEVEHGVTLLHAAEQAGIYLDTLCGGEGLCGECRVRVVNGNARADKHAIGFFSRDELETGYVLACQTTVEDDLTVEVPLRSRLEGENILTEGIPIYSNPEKVVLHKRPKDPAAFFEPVVSKTFLNLPEPTTTDNTADIDRVTRELRKVTRYTEFEITLDCLRDLAAILRQHEWKVTVTHCRHNTGGKIMDIEGGDTTGHQYGLAIDVGTTTVVVQLVDLKTGKVIGVEGSHNRQARYGEDVISRMVFACGRGSLQPLHEAVITNINKLTEAIVNDKNINTRDIIGAVAAGNTTMSHFLLGLQPCNLRLEPYVPTATVYPQVVAGELGLNIHPRGLIEVLPSVASYVGGDIVAGVLATGLADKPEISCLIDVGTNGEIVIGNNEWLVCCSASAGPAFEGGGARSGMRATKGAIQKIRIHDGKVSYETIGKVKPRGVCGSGFIDAIYEMVRNGIIGQQGKFNISGSDGRFINGDDPRYILAFAEETETGEPVTVSEAEIGNLIKSKGAVFAAMKSLVDYVGLSFSELDTIYVAGGFGSSLDIPKAVAIGLLPDVDTKRIHFVGNSSVMGARMALLSQPAFEKTIDIARKMTNIELSNYPPFMNEFVAALFLPHTDASLFPSVQY